MTCPVKPYATDSYERKAQEMIIEGEGYSEKPYKDTLGNWTVGCGHRIKGIERKTNEEHFKHDFGDAWKMAALHHTTPENRVVMACIIFQLGYAKFLRFTECRSALQCNNWDKAIYEMKHDAHGGLSPWYQQTPRRIEMLENYIRETVMK